MKRALLVALLLAVLALLVWFTLDRTRRVGPPASSAIIKPDAENREEAALETELLNDRAELNAAEGESRSRPPDPARHARDPSAAASAVKSSQVSLVIAFADSGKPIGLAQANLAYSDPARAQNSSGGEGAIQVESQETHRMTPAGLGKFVLDVPVGARLRLANVCGIPAMLEGPRTESNAASRFKPLQTPLDQVVRDAPLEIRLAAGPGRDLRGVVCDSRTMRPIAGAKLSIRTAVRRYVYLSSDLEGRFVIGETGARASMTVERPGYCPLGLTLDAERFAQGATDLVVLLEPTLHVAGSVVDAHGDPVSGVRLTFFARRFEHQSSGRPLIETAWANCDADGNFRVEGVPPCEDAVLFGNFANELQQARLLPPRELGPVHGDLDGLVLVSPDSTTILVRGVLPDGTPVEGESCHVFCEEPHATQFVNRYHFLSDDCMRVPVGVELHLVALTRARPEDARHVLVGRRVLIADASEAEPQKVQITLSESFDYDPPPSDAQVIEIFESDILSTLDLRILDKSGRPLSRDTEVVLELRGSEKISLHPTDGWIRLRGIPGTHPVRLQVGDESEAFDLAIPWSGYGRLEKNMRIGP